MDIEAQIEELKASPNLPRHVAIIMDGNGRWAKQRQLAAAGRSPGRPGTGEDVRADVRETGNRISHAVHFFAGKLETAPGEVEGLMMFLEDVLRTEYLELDENGVRLAVIGRTGMLAESTRSVLDETIRKLEHNNRLLLTLAISYGGRSEIRDAACRLADDVRSGRLATDEVTEDVFRGYLYAPLTPDPDLLIRTSGEMRISNFLLWQIAYSEIHVTDVLWPDFDEEHLLNGIRDYTTRDRRFGLSS